MAQKRPPSWERWRSPHKTPKRGHGCPLPPFLASFSALPPPSPTGAQAGADRGKCSVTWKGAPPFPGQAALTPVQRRRGGVALQIFKLGPD